MLVTKTQLYIRYKVNLSQSSRNATQKNIKLRSTNTQNLLLLPERILLKKGISSHFGFQHLCRFFGGVLSWIKLDDSRKKILSHRRHISKPLSKANSSYWKIVFHATFFLLVGDVIYALKKSFTNCSAFSLIYSRCSYSKNYQLRFYEFGKVLSSNCC